MTSAGSLIGVSWLLGGLCRDGSGDAPALLCPRAVHVLDRIDEIVPPGTDVGTLDQAYRPPALENLSLRRRPLTERAAA